jgi:hypothetical protein
MNVKHVVTASLVGILLIPRVGLAQTQPSSGPLRESVRREAVRLASAAAQTAPRQQPPPQPQHKNWAARHPIALGAILGIVAGGAIAQISDGRVTNSDGRPVFLVGAVPGLLIGSSIGVAVACLQD